LINGADVESAMAMGLRVMLKSIVTNPTNAIRLLLFIGDSKKFIVGAILPDNQGYATKIFPSNFFH